MSDVFNDHILGYDSVKKTLRQVSDMVKNLGAYEDCGLNVPTAILLIGPAYSGKRTLCRCLAEDIGRAALTFRNSQDRENCRENLEQAFKEATEHTPSILILENIQTYDEETMAYLSIALDGCRGNDILVMATATTTENIPISVTRSFDYTLTLKPQSGNIWIAVVDRFIQENVPMYLAEDLSIRDIAMALDGQGCGVLDAVMKRSMANAIYDHSPTIRKQDYAKAVLDVLYRYEEGDGTLNEGNMRRVVIHEACHTVLSEELFPGAASFVAVPRSADCFFSGISDSLHLPCNSDQDIISSAMVALAGMAGEDLFLGKRNGVGARLDLQQALSDVDYYISECCGAGFPGLVDRRKESSEQKKAETKRLVVEKTEELYKQVKEILQRKAPFVQGLAEELLEHEFLLHSDIMSMKDQAGIDCLT